MNCCHLPKRNREIPSAESETQSDVWSFSGLSFSVSEMKSEKWNGFLDLTQMQKPVGDTRKEFVLWGDVVTDVAVFGRF